MKKSQDQINRELYERVKPFIDADRRKNISIEVFMEILKSLRWLVLIPFPAIWHWIKSKINGE